MREGKVGRGGREKGKDGKEKKKERGLFRLNLSTKGIVLLLSPKYSYMLTYFLYYG